jgi:cyclopropane-fatty-acyl-phospholipid synthase
MSLSTSEYLQTQPIAESSELTGSRRHKLSWLQRLSRKRLISWLSSLEGGIVEFSDAEESVSVGQNQGDDLSTTWKINSPQFYRHLALNGSNGVAESYLQGQWQTSDLTTLLRILCRGMDDIPKSNFLTEFLGKLCRKVVQYIEQNTRDRSRRHIAAHYDLGNDFFELFLDPTLMYSCAYFANDDATLEQASLAKLDRICDKLNLRPGEKVLEIGSGWGGFAVHTASRFDINLTTTTISQAQFQKTEQRIRAAGVSERVRLLDSDYRDLTGQYDKLVSIEMVEAVGERYLDAYFSQCGKLLRPGGRFVLQGILMPEQRYATYKSGIDFIQKYIFPGGFLPSLSAMQESIGRTSNLRLEELEDFTPHYAKTLARWRKNFFNRLEEVKQLGFDDRFIRMWEYYLCYCEAAFREQAVRVVQAVWEKPMH